MVLKIHWAMIIACILAGCTSNAKKDQIQKSKADPPKLLKPVVRKIWIPEEVRNGGAEWIEGHYMFRIEKETTWSR